MVQSKKHSKQEPDYQWIIEKLKTYEVPKTEEIRIRRGVMQGQACDHFMFRVIRSKIGTEYVLEYITGTQGMRTATTLYYNSTFELQRAVTTAAVYTAERYLKRWDALTPTVRFLASRLTD